MQHFESLTKCWICFPKSSMGVLWQHKGRLLEQAFTDLKHEQGAAVIKA